MMVTDTCWNALCLRLGLDRGAANHSVWLRAQYGHPARHYHNLQHLAECLELFNEARQNQEVEEKSSRVVISFLLHQGATDSLILDVSRLVMTTKAHQHRDHADAKWLMDIGILG
jgi:predicted metal-dependent HD superfamily phosphohydrolase